MMSQIRILFLLSFISFLFYSCSEDDENKISTAKRTVLVYMAADNNLSYLAKNNIQQMQENLSSNPENGNLVVYIDPENEAPRLIQITPQGQKTLKVYPEQNSASSIVLRSVIDEVCNFFPSENYGLVLWSHATGWLPANTSYTDIEGNFGLRQDISSPIRDPFTKAFAQDGSDGTDWLELSDLAAAIPDHRFDYIIFDACYMGSVEVIYALRNKADAIIASPTEVLSEGFPYDQMTSKLLATHPDLEEICQIYFNFYNSLDGIEQSASIALIKTAAMQDLLVIVKEITSNQNSIPLLLNEIQCYDRFNRHVIFDIDDYISRIANEDQLNRFRQQLNKVVLFKLSTKQFYYSFDITHFNGLSTYIPQASLPLLNDFYFTQLEWGKGL